MSTYSYAGAGSASEYSAGYGGFHHAAAAAAAAAGVFGAKSLQTANRPRTKTRSSAGKDHQHIRLIRLIRIIFFFSSSLPPPLIFINFLLSLSLSLFLSHSVDLTPPLPSNPLAWLRPLSGIHLPINLTRSSSSSFFSSVPFRSVSFRAGMRRRKNQKGRKEKCTPQFRNCGWNNIFVVFCFRPLDACPE